MKRSIIDKVISSIGLLLAAVLLIASAVLFYTYNFIHTQVHDQLAPQNIVLPAKDTPAFTSLSQKDQDAIRPYAGQQVTTGAQAAVFANNYIAAHIQSIGGGKTYSELSNESRANPEDKVLAGKVETVFRGETLRGTLLTAFAFDSMAVVAKYVAIGALVAGIVFAFLSLLGFKHSKVASKKKSIRKK